MPRLTVYKRTFYEWRLISMNPLKIKIKVKNALRYDKKYLIYLFWLLFLNSLEEKYLANFCWNVFGGVELQTLCLWF